MLVQTIQGITLYVDQFADKIKDFAVAAANEKYALSLDSGMLRLHVHFLLRTAMITCPFTRTL